MAQKTINPKDLKVIEKSTPIRRELARESFQLFFEIYFAHYITSHRLHGFKKEMFHLIEDEKKSFTTIMAFRGSGKSTIINTAFPLWSILGKHNQIHRYHRSDTSPGKTVYAKSGKKRY